MHIFKMVRKMIVYREFAKNEKNMQELMKEIITRYIIENSCNIYQTELKSDKPRINFSNRICVLGRDEIRNAR